MNKILLYNFIFLIISFKQIKNESKNKNRTKNINNNIIKRHLSEKEKVQQLNNIINIYNPFSIVSYISSIISKNGDLFITINSEEKTTTRLIYAIKSDGSNYFTDSDNKPYKVMNSSYELNKYPLLCILNLFGEDYLITFTQNSMFELYDFSINEVYSQGIFQIIKFNSNVNKNTFASLNYYDNKDYILNSYVDKRERYFLLQKLKINQVYIPSRNIENIQNKVAEGMVDSSVTCFEALDLIECLFVDEYKIYTISIFKISNLEEIYRENIEDNYVNFKEPFSKCIHIKNYIGAFIYFRKKNVSPIIQFKKFNIISSNSSEYELEDYRNKIVINSKQKYNLGNNYVYNDIIKIDENNIIYVNTKNESDILMIILFKLFEQSKSILVNYYKIELKENYNIRIYCDINVFKFNGLLGIGMTNYNFSLSENETYANYFIIGEAFENNISIPSNIVIFSDEEDNKYQLKVEDFINIKNNIFGYQFSIKIISDINEDSLGFYLYSNELQKKIETNLTISNYDIINFELISDIGVKKDNYSFEYEGEIKESDYNNLISFPDSYEIYLSNDTTCESFYEPKFFSLKKGFFNFSVNYCYKTCKTCTYLGDNVSHHCDTCSKKFPFIYNISNSTLGHGYNCMNKCPENYTFGKNRICIHIDDFDENEYDNINDTNKISDLLGFKNYIEITRNIKEMSDEQIIIKNNSDYKIYAYDIDEKNEIFFFENNLTYIDFTNSNIKNCIENEQNLDNGTNIYALVLETYNDNPNALTDDLYFVLFFENGSELYICQDETIKVNISSPIKNLTSANYDYAVYFQKQGYDIYDKNSSFYYDICIPVYYENDDITVEDRQQEIYPNNMIIINPNCEYKKADLENKRIVYECNILDIYKQNKSSEENTKNDNCFEIQEEKFIYYLLDYINYKILVCHNVFFHLDNYQSNIGLIFSSITSLLIIVLIILFCFRGLSKIKIMMYNEVPTFPKLLKLIKKYYKSKNKSHLNKINNTVVNNPYKRKSKKNSFDNYNNNNNENNRSNVGEIISPNKSSSTNTIIPQKSDSQRKTIFETELNANNNRNIIGNKESLEIKYKNKKRLKNIFNDEEIEEKSEKEKDKEKEKDLNNLPFTKAIVVDKRNIFQLLKEKIMDKMEIIDIFTSREIKELYLSKYFLFLLIDVTMTALLFSDSVITHKFHNNGKLDFIVTMTLTICSNLLSLLLEHYISLLIRYEEIMERIKEIKQEYVFLKVCKRFYRILIIQIITFFIISICFILFCIYYLVIFCKIYNKTQISLIKAYFVSLLEGIVINIIISIVISGSRIYGIKFKNKYIYNTSKYIDGYF